MHFQGLLRAHFQVKRLIPSPRSIHAAIAMVRRASIKVKWPQIVSANNCNNGEEQGQVQLGPVEDYVLKLVKSGTMRIPKEFVRLNIIVR
jgi:hypothetical protein